MASTVGFSPVNSQRYATQATEGQAAGKAAVKAPVKEAPKAEPRAWGAPQNGVGGGVLMAIVGLGRSYFSRD